MTKGILHFIVLLTSLISFFMPFMNGGTPASETFSPGKSSYLIRKRIHYLKREKELNVNIEMEANPLDHENTEEGSAKLIPFILHTHPEKGINIATKAPGYQSDGHYFPLIDRHSKDTLKKSILKELLREKYLKQIKNTHPKFVMSNRIDEEAYEKKNFPTSKEPNLTFPHHPYFLASKTIEKKDYIALKYKQFLRNKVTYGREIS